MENIMKNEFEILPKSKIDKFHQLTEILLRENAKCNLTRIVEPAQIDVRHYADSLIVSDILRDYEANLKVAPNLIDIGSGAGFPCLAIAIVFDNWRITSVESTGKKADFQKLAAKELGLTNFKVVSARAEDIAKEDRYWQKFDIATARAVSHLAIITEFALPFLRVGGIFLAWKGPKADQEIIESEKIVAKLGISSLESLPYSLEGMEHGRIIKAEKVKDTPTMYPRAFGILKKTVPAGPK
jgi:16S rRNA (guanine527-N7)-methyltransferase